MPEEKQTPAKTDSGQTAIPTLRTLQTETTDYIRKKNISLADIALAESKKQRLADVSTKNFPKQKLIVIIVVSIAAALAAGAFLWWQFQKKSGPIASSKIPPPLIFSETEEILEFSDKKEFPTLLKSRLENSGVKTGQMQYLALAEKIQENGLAFINTKRFLNLIAPQAPEDLINVLNEKFYLGAFKDNASSANAAIIIFEVKTFDKAFATMLNWESSLKRDLSVLALEDAARETGNLGFSDAIIKNQDARIMKNINNQPIILYAFFSKRFLIISSSQKAFEETIIRLNQSLPLN
ncbi:MAG: hypothetical protein UU96_C0005G0021 [Parcubacteria group bacterium GW2011_GWC2_42_13]|nr:MAG: hypothetical protein UU96_C0005G0021 [Parcubacteria group bacterium GW2011_GWC2_42_13]